MTNRPKNSWDDFKTVGKAQDFKRPPTLGNRLWVAFGTLVIGLVYGYIASRILLFAFGGFLIRYQRLGFFHAPRGTNIAIVLFAFGWAIYAWITGMREEAETRGRLERHQARSEKIARLQARRLLREEQMEREDEEE